MKIIAFIVSLVFVSGLSHASWTYSGTATAGTITDSDEGWVLKVEVRNGNELWLENNCVSVTGTSGLIDFSTGITGPNGAMQLIGTKSYNANKNSSFKGNNDITKVVLPEGFTTLAERAFNECRNLGEIILPSTLTTIMTESFVTCPALTNITPFLPPNVNFLSNAFGGTRHVGPLVLSCPLLKEIAGSAFKDAVGITSIDMSQSGVTNVGSIAFGYISTLGEVLLPDSLEIVSSDGFRSASITNITPFLPPNVRFIGKDSFRGIKVKKPLVLSCPDLTSIGETAFRDSTGITAIDMSLSGVTTIVKGAFGYVNTIGEILFPNCLESIDSIAFVQNASPYALTNVVPFLPISVINIASEAFNGCSGIVNPLRLSNPALTTIGASAFANTCNIPYIDMSGSGIKTIGSSAFQGNFIYDNTASPGSNKTGYIRLSDCLEFIDNNAFRHRAACTNIEPFLPSTVTNLGTYAFGTCISLKTPLYLESESPVTILGNAFNSAQMETVRFGIGVTNLNAASIFVYNNNLSNVWFSGDCPIFSTTVFPVFGSDFITRFFIPKNNLTWDNYIAGLITAGKLFVLTGPEENAYIAKYGVNAPLPIGKFVPPAGTSAKYQYLVQWRPPLKDGLITVIVVK